MFIYIDNDDNSQIMFDIKYQRLALNGVNFDNNNCQNIDSCWNIETSSLFVSDSTFNTNNGTHRNNIYPCTHYMQYMLFQINK